MTELAGAAQSNVLVFCVDAKFFLPCAFLIERLAADPARDRYDIAIVHDGLSEAQFARLSERVGRQIVAVSVRGADGQIANRSPDEPISRATYFRLLMHRLLPAHYSRILYLDVDLVIERLEIADLFDLDLGKAAFAAVRGKHYLGLLCPDLAPNLPQTRFDRDRTVDYMLGLGLDLGDPYLNSGVLLIDRARWTALDIPGRALTFAEQYPERCVYLDQSAINAVSAGHWVELSLRWNYPATLLSPAIDEAVRPVIRHYAGPQKPWNSEFWGARISDPYREWLEASGWPGRFPPGRAIAAPAARPVKARGGWLRQLLRRARRRPRRADDLRAAAQWGSQQRAGTRHAVTAILTFSRFIDLDAAERRALVKAIAESGDKPRKRVSSAAA